MTTCSYNIIRTLTLLQNYPFLGEDDGSKEVCAPIGGGSALFGGGSALFGGGSALFGGGSALFGGEAVCS